MFAFSVLLSNFQGNFSLYLLVHRILTLYILGNIEKKLPLKAEHTLRSFSVDIKARCFLVITGRQLEQFFLCHLNLPLK